MILRCLFFNYNFVDFFVGFIKIEKHLRILCHNDVINFM
jgi:hypothetical protein